MLVCKKTKKNHSFIHNNQKLRKTQMVDCYGLNMCLPKIHVLKPTLQGDSSRKYNHLWEVIRSWGQTLGMGLAPL